MDQENLAYLLRLQRNDQSDPWRVSVQNVHTGELIRFANEREMFRYLMQRLAIGSMPPAHEDEEEGAREQDTDIF